MYTARTDPDDDTITVLDRPTSPSILVDDDSISIRIDRKVDVQFFGALPDGDTSLVLRSDGVDVILFLPCTVDEFKHMLELA